MDATQTLRRLEVAPHGLPTYITGHLGQLVGRYLEARGQLNWASHDLVVSATLSGEIAHFTLAISERDTQPVILPGTGDSLITIRLSTDILATTNTDARLVTPALLRCHLEPRLFVAAGVSQTRPPVLLGIRTGTSQHLDPNGSLVGVIVVSDIGYRRDDSPCDVAQSYARLNSLVPDDMPGLLLHAAYDYSTSSDTFGDRSLVIMFQCWRTAEQLKTFQTKYLDPLATANKLRKARIFQFDVIDFGLDPAHEFVTF